MPRPAPRVAPATRATRPERGFRVRPATPVRAREPFVRSIVLSARGRSGRRAFVFVPADRAPAARADDVHALVAVDVRADAAVHRFRLVDFAIGPLTGRGIRRRVEHMDAALRGVRIPRAGVAVVVRDDVVAAVAVEIDDGDLVPARDLVEDDAALPLAAFLRVDHDLVAVPRLDGREEALAVLLADADVARAQARRLVVAMSSGQERLLELHVLAAAGRAVEGDAFEAGDEKLFAPVAVPHHRPHAVDDAGNLGRHDVTLPVLRAVPEDRRLVLIVGG